MVVEPAAPVPPVRFKFVAVVNLILVFPAPGFAPKLVPRNKTVAPAVRAAAEAKVRIGEPPVPETTVTVDAPEVGVRAPTASAALVEATFEPLNTNSPPVSVRALESLTRSVLLAVVLSRVRVPPDAIVKEVLVAVPVPLNVKPPALMVVAPE